MWPVKCLGILSYYTMCKMNVYNIMCFEIDITVMYKVLISVGSLYFIMMIYTK